MQNKKAFTIIELAIIIAIISFLAFLAIPRLTDLLYKTKENETKANLELLRTAIEEYYEQNSEYPIDITNEKFLSEYLGEIPTVELGRYHANSQYVKINGTFDDSGGWYYDPTTGAVYVNCTHKDTKDQSINSW